MKILVVDEVGFVRHWCRHLLQRNGYAVSMAGCGFEALQELVHDPTIDVVLTNLALGDMDALQFFQAARRLERRTDGGPAAAPPEFLLMTSLRPGTGGDHGDLDKLKTAAQCGFADVLFKPLDVDKLLDVLGRIQSRRSAAGTAATVSAEELQATVQHIQRTAERIIRPDGAASLAGFVSELETAVRQLRKLTTAEAE